LRALPALTLLVLAFSAGCGGGAESIAASRLEADGTATLRLVARDDHQARLSVEIADTREERAVGLSGRPELAPDAGMLFVFQARGAGFWMKDTLIPLSVAFIASCGEIVHIVDMEPLSLQLHNSPVDYAFAIETNQGWYQQNRIAVGDTVELPPELLPDGCTS
jgi:uncharacterized membrane protein (UPF0127 family)